MANEGSYGYYWSASPYTTTAGSGLRFHASFVFSQYTGSRGYGFPLRCIQGFTLRGAGRRSGTDEDARKEFQGRQSRRQ